MPPPESTIEPIPRNQFLGAASDGLRTARSKLDVVPLPQFLGGGLGNLLIGSAPEEVDQWSYGFSPFREHPTHSPYIPQLREDRAQGVADTLFLPVGEAAGLAKLGASGLRGAYNAGMGAARGAIDAPVAMGRRKFVKDAGTVAAGGAAAAVVPDGVRSMAKWLDNPAGTVAKAAVRATPSEFYAAHRAARLSAMDAADVVKSQYDAGLRDAWKRHTDAVDAKYADYMKNDPHPHRADVGDATWEDEYIADFNDHSPEYTDLSLEAGSKWRSAYESSLADAEKKLRADPRFAGYKTESELEQLARQDMDLYWKEARKIGLLPDDEIATQLKAGKQYVDPTSGNTAVLNEYGDLEWRDKAGNQKRFQHWLPDPRFAAKVKAKANANDYIPF